jgi:sulfoxide reductase heme-binding subunit YedZ
MVLKRKTGQRLIWWLLFSSALIPFLLLVFAAFSQQLGADPAKYIVLETGEWALNFLWLSLAITPLKMLFGWSWLIKYRRMIGLFSFFYVAAHFLSYATFILGWQLNILVTEITQRPYAIVGFISFILLLPLVITSTKKMQKRLKKRWVTLHKLVYVIALLALLHIVWQIRSDFSQALIYGVILAWLLGYRLYKREQKKNKQKVVI